MYDQAQKLREKVKTLQETKPTKSTRVITVTSGKGGVGKSNFSLNFALALSERGLKVVILDLDLGLANIDVLMGQHPRSNLMQMVDRRLSIWDVLSQGPNGLEYISGGSGFQDIVRMSEDDLNFLFSQLNELQGYADMIILDTGAGITSESLRFILSSDEVFLVTTPEPTSIADAYAVLKVAVKNNATIKFRLVVNRVASNKEGRLTTEKLNLVTEQFLKIRLPKLGYIPDDAEVSKAVKKQVPFFLASPNSSASHSMRDLVSSYLMPNSRSAPGRETPNQANGLRGFLNKMRRFIGS